MTVTVDYLVVCSGDKDLVALLAAMLKNALEEVDKGSPEEEVLKQSITIRYTKTREDGRQIRGFSVQFTIDEEGESAEASESPEEGESPEKSESPEERMESLINTFSGAVAGCTDEGIEHLLKLNDPQLRCRLRNYGDEIFEIEMQLREALTLIFVDTYGEDFYALLKDVTVEPTGWRAPEQSQMQAQYENQFFFLLFSNYINVNVRKPLSVKRIEEYMKRAEAFEELKGMITAERPITEGRYIDFLDKLKKEVEPIEELRNCVAHNRSIPEDIIANYEKAKNRLLKEINELLTSQANREEEL